MAVHFSSDVVGDYWTTSDNRWNIELGKHRHRQFFPNMDAIGVNLEEGYQNFESDHGSERLEGLLAFILRTARPGVPLKEFLHADFVCRRGLLRNLAINSNSSTFITFHAIRLKGVIFLCEDKSISDAPEKLRRAMYYNLKFENLMTTPQSRNITASKTSETKTVIHAALEKEGQEPIRVFYAAETDCVDLAGNALELKMMSKKLEEGWDKSRSMAWYMHCFLGNVNTIVVGERQRNRLRDFRPVTVDAIQLHNNHGWTLQGCLNQLHTTLAFVRQYMWMDGVPMKFTCKAGQTYVSTSEFGLYIVPDHFLRSFPF